MGGSRCVVMKVLVGSVGGSRCVGMKVLVQCGGTRCVGMTTGISTPHRCFGMNILVPKHLVWGV